MEVLNYILQYADWETRLSLPPYNLKIVWGGDYVLLKYNPLNADFAIHIVQEARGCIFYIPGKDHTKAKVVCYPFDKFFNYGEVHAARIDWSTARVGEKVDGSLMKLFYHLGEWHVTTNGTINAQNVATLVQGVNFYNVFRRALVKNGNPLDFFASLDPNYTYMFELVSPETRVTIEYPEAALYFLGARDMRTLKETAAAPIDRSFVKSPKSYSLSTLEDCIEAASRMSADEEGFVVCDAQFNRIKIKSPEYLIASHIRNNNSITVNNILTALRGGKIDDYYAYIPDYHDFIDQVVTGYHSIAAQCDKVYSAACAQLYPGVAWYEVVNAQPVEYRDYCYRRKAKKVNSSYEYLDTLSVNRLAKWIDDYLISY